MKTSARTAAEQPDVYEVGDAYSVPRYEDVKLSAGTGRAQPGTEAVTGRMQLGAQWVRGNLPAITSPRNLRILTALGNSMSPLFNDGDPLLVDIGVREHQLDAVYAFLMGGRLFVKTLQRLPNSAINVISNNATVYPPYVIDASNGETMEILGRVVWAWNGRKL